MATRRKIKQKELSAWTKYPAVKEMEGFRKRAQMDGYFKQLLKLQK